ncbi:MAG: hypothetical protein PHS73_01865 [Candidatus Peribacteraceae bacterium]|nr:hypothetical protein [Candidatus Peribacteraceae bacterium]
MKYKFILGIVAGVSSLALAVPLLVQAAPSDRPESPSVPSQECVQAMADGTEARLASMDAMLQARKSALQTHKTALAAAAAIADDTARKDALQKAHEDFRASQKQAHDQLPAAVQEAMDAVRTACEGQRMGARSGFGFGKDGMEKPFGGPEGRQGAGWMQQLGMTQEEIKAALESGKTIKEIAEEQGVTLPDQPRGQGMGMRGGIRGHGPWQSDDAGSTSSSDQ